jgi:hypothetical protein
MEAHSAVTGLHATMGGKSEHIAKPVKGAARDHLSMASQELTSAEKSIKSSHGANSPEHKKIKSAIKSLTEARHAEINSRSKR